MWMTQYVRKVKIQLRDVYRLVPSRVVDGEPCFDKVKDGIYPMEIGGKKDMVIVNDGKFILCLPVMEPKNHAKDTECVSSL